MEIFAGFLIGLLVGVILGLLGGGGSLLIVAIVYLIKYPMDPGTAYIGFLVGVSAAVGVIPRIREKLIDWPTVLALGIPVSLGMLLVRFWLFDKVPEEFVLSGSGDDAIVVTKRMIVLIPFAMLLLFSAATMLGYIGKNIKPNPNLRIEKPTTYYFRLTFFGLLIGILPAFSGAGGGVLIVPLLVILFGTEMKTVVGTSLGIVAMKSFVGFFLGDVPRLAKNPDITIDVWFLVGFAAVMIVGVLIGSRISHRFDNAKLKQVFAWFLVGLATFIVVNELFLQSS
jgi:uncharacterized membrane protein YfcA